MAKQRLFELVSDGALGDEQVIARVRAGDVALFEVLMRRHNQRVYRAVRAIVRDELETEEVMQQAYVSAFAHLEQYQGAARFSTWLVRIAVNEALGLKRRGARWVAVDGGGHAEDDISSTIGSYVQPEDEASARELAALVEAVIDELPELYRSAFMLREIEGMGTADAAEVLGVSEAVIKTRLHRAKGLIRQKLESRLGAATLQAFAFRDHRCDRVVAAVLERIARPRGG